MHAPCVVDGHTALCPSSIQELHALTDLVHYHVVRVYGLSINRTISIISEFVPAGPLDGYLQDNAASVSGGDMLSYAAQVATVGVGVWCKEGGRGRRGRLRDLCISCSKRCATI